MNLFHTHTSWQARHNADEVLRSGCLSEGVMVKKFEQALEEELGLRNPVCTNSGTAALHLALRMAGIRAGDEVILPTQTFIATGLAILYCGATPVFADVDPRTGLLDVEDAAKRVTNKTKMIMTVAWCGLPPDLYPLDELVRKRGLYVVLDAAQALGATYLNKSPSEFAEFTCYSFQATKHLTTGDGGCLCSWFRSDVPDMKRLRWFGLDREEPFDEVEERPTLAWEWGYKYHMNDLAAAVGLGNLEGFKFRVLRRQQVAEQYRRELEGVPGLTIPPLPPDRTHAYYAFPVLVERRQYFARALREKNVPCSVICRRIDRHPVFGGLRLNLPGTKEYDERQINLPCHEALTDEDVRKVIEVVKAGW